MFANMLLFLSSFSIYIEVYRLGTKCLYGLNILKHNAQMSFKLFTDVHNSMQFSQRFGIAIF